MFSKVFIWIKGVTFPNLVFSLFVSVSRNWSSESNDLQSLSNFYCFLMTTDDIIFDEVTFIIMWEGIMISRDEIQLTSKSLLNWYENEIGFFLL